MNRTKAYCLVSVIAMFLFFLAGESWPGDRFIKPSLPRLQEVADSKLRQEDTVVITVPGDIPWTDTGIDMTGGQEVVFAAAGKISLQRGNPQADCGPDGYDLRTVQQPLPEKNLGALIGKVVISISVTVDEKTGEEKKEEVAEIFFVGSENHVMMPAPGRLFLGINENVTGDNAGQFIVTITKAEK
jgi:hypothetical protein